MLREAPSVCASSPDWRHDGGQIKAYAVADEGRHDGDGRSIGGLISGGILDVEVIGTGTQ